MEFRANVRMEFCRRVALSIFESGMASEIAARCVPVFVSICVWQQRASPCMCPCTAFDKPVALMTCFWRKSKYCSRYSVRVQLF